MNSLQNDLTGETSALVRSYGDGLLFDLPAPSVPRAVARPVRSAPTSARGRSYANERVKSDFKRPEGLQVMHDCTPEEVALRRKWRRIQRESSF